MAERHRMDRCGRRAMLLAAAMRVAGEYGIAGVNHRRIGAAARPACSHVTVRRYLGDQDSLRRAVAKAARDSGCRPLIVEADALGL